MSAPVPNATISEARGPLDPLSARCTENHRWRFPDIHKIKFEGPDSNNPLAFRFYDENEIIEGKTMKDQLRFSVAYWHTMRGTGADPFGPHDDPAWEGKVDDVPMRSTASRWLSNSSRNSAPPSSASTIATSPRGRQPGRNQQEPRPGRQGDQGRDGADRHPVALGHGQPLQQPAVCARRRHELQCRQLRLCAPR